mgnify:CR=1 FL=1
MKIFLKKKTFSIFTPFSGLDHNPKCSVRRPSYHFKAFFKTLYQAVTEASYVNIPVIALCDSDAPSKFVDIAIPCNNKGVHSIGLIWWLLAREVLRLRGTIPRSAPWDIMPDLFFYRAPEDIEKQEQQEKLEEESKKIDQNADGPVDFTIDAPTIGAAEDGGWENDIPETKEFTTTAKVENWDQVAEKPAAAAATAATTGDNWEVDGKFRKSGQI